MPRTRPTGTLEDLNKYLKANQNASIAEAKKAVNYKGPPVKPKAGNTTTNRRNLRMGLRGSNGDGERRRLLKERPPQNRQEQNQNRRQNYMRNKLNKLHGRGKFVIDHKYSLNKLGQQLWGLGEKLKVRRINRIEAENGPVGDRPQNRRIITNGKNEKLRQAERAGQQNKPKSKAPMRFTPAVNTGLPGVVSLRSMIASGSARTVDTLPGAPHIFIP
jgi:hypothetical protein